MEIILLIIVLIVMIIGLLGVVFPFLPGLSLIFVSYAVYGFVTSWQEVTILSTIIMAAVVFISLGIDFFAVGIGAKKYGASRSGVWGAILGGLLGVVIFNFFGLVFGPLIGAFIGELIDGKPHPLAMKATMGSVVGLLAGSFIKIIIGVIMIGVFIWQIV